MIAGRSVCGLVFGIACTVGGADVAYRPVRIMVPSRFGGIPVRSRRLGSMEEEIGRPAAGMREGFRTTASDGHRPAQNG